MGDGPVWPRWAGASRRPDPPDGGVHLGGPRPWRLVTPDRGCDLVHAHRLIHVERQEAEHAPGDRSTDGHLMSVADECQRPQDRQPEGRRGLPNTAELIVEVGLGYTERIGQPGERLALRPADAVLLDLADRAHAEPRAAGKGLLAQAVASAVVPKQAAQRVGGTGHRLTPCGQSVPGAPDRSPCRKAGLKAHPLSFPSGTAGSAGRARHAAPARSLGRSAPVLWRAGPSRSE